MKEFPAWYEELATKLCEAVTLVREAGSALSELPQHPRTASRYLLSAAQIITDAARSVDERFPPIPRKKP